MGLIKQSREIGAMMRVRREAVGMTQEVLGELLGVSYQQVQKYENGSNKLSPERLQQVAKALGVPIGFFFGQEGEAPTTTGTQRSAAERFRTAENREEMELLKRFRRLRTPAHRAIVLSLVLALGGKRDR